MKLKTLIQAGCSLLTFIFIFLPWVTLSVSIAGFSLRESGNAFQNSMAVGIFALIASLFAMGWYTVCILKEAGVVKFKLPAKVEFILNVVAPSLLVLFGFIGIIVGFAGSEGFGHAGAGAWLYTILGGGMLALNFIKLDTVVGKTAAKKPAEKKDDKKEEKKDEK